MIGKSAGIHVALTGHIVIPSHPVFDLSHEAREVLEPTICRILVEQGNHYTADAVVLIRNYEAIQIFHPLPQKYKQTKTKKLDIIDDNNIKHTL